jgi:hypothetical protein
MTTKHTGPDTDTPHYVEIAGDMVNATTGELLPAIRDNVAELDALPATLDELIAQYIEPEPDPRQVFLWIAEMGEIESDDEDDPSLSIMVRIMQGTSEADILGAQEIVPADALLGEVITVKDVKFRKSAYTQGAKCYALITAHRETTDSEVLISCGGKNVQTQLLRLRHVGLLPTRASIVKSSKPTANGFYPLWLEPR